LPSSQLQVQWVYKHPILLTNIYPIENKEDIASNLAALLNKSYTRKDNAIVALIYLLQNAIKNKIIPIDKVVDYLKKEKKNILKKITKKFKKRNQESLNAIIELYKLINKNGSDLNLQKLNNKTIFLLLMTETNIPINGQTNNNPYTLIIDLHLNKIKDKKEQATVINHLLSLNVFFIDYALFEFYQSHKEHQISISIKNFILANKDKFIVQWLNRSAASQSILSLIYCKSFYTNNIESENFNTTLLKLITNENLRNAKKTNDKKENETNVLLSLILSPLNIHDKVHILSQL